MCILVRSVRLCVFSVSLCDGRSATTACLSSQCQPFLSLHHTRLLYDTADTMITSPGSLSRCLSPSVFNIKTYHETSHNLWVCLLHQLSNIDRSKIAVLHNLKLIPTRIFLTDTGGFTRFSSVALCPGVYWIQVFLWFNIVDLQAIMKDGKLYQSIHLHLFSILHHKN